MPKLIASKVPAETWTLTGNLQGQALQELRRAEGLKRRSGVNCANCRAWGAGWERHSSKALMGVQSVVASPALADLSPCCKPYIPLP